MKRRGKCLGLGEADMKRLVFIGALTLGATGSGASASGSPARTFTAGPRDLPASAAPVLASSFDELQALVADPSGPREIELGPFSYRGDLVVKRPVSLRGHKETVLEGTGHGTPLTILANDTSIQNLTVRKSGRRHTAEDSGIKARGERVHIADVRVLDSLFGVAFAECRDCSLERSHIVGGGDDMELRGDGIKLWESHGSTVSHCVVEGARDIVVWYTRHATLTNNVVRGSRYGTHFMYAHDATLRDSRFEDDVVGVFVMYSLRLTLEGNVLAGARGAAGVGLGLKDSDGISLRHNWIVGNTTGTYVDNSPRTEEQPVNFDGNVLALNDVGVRLHSSQRGVHFRGNDLRNNATLIEVDGQGDALAADFHENHYSDYAGYDLDGDGTGDVAYEVKALSSELTEAHPTLKFFTGTAALGAIDVIAHAVPVLSAKRLLVDASPHMNRHFEVEP